MVKAYSYIRISSTEQRKGRGEQRQLEAAQAYAAQHGLELDDTLRDLGKSGYHGDHIKSGALGRFVELVATGQIPVGSYLLVENLDRLSRQTPIDAQAQFIALLQAGIKIVTLTDGQVYERGRDFTQMIISLTIMSRGHEESARKSYNTKKNHDANQRDILAGKPRFRSACVGWIDQAQIPDSKDCKFTLNQHADTVRRIFELADQGVGPLSIARMLNEANTPPLKAIGKKWWENTVSRILRNEIAIGTLQLYDTVDGKLVPLGNPIPNYYPAVVSEEMFWRVQRNRPKVARTGRKGGKYANLFQTITCCVHCGGGLGLVQSTKNDYKYYRCKTRYADKKCEGPAALFPYNALEKAILDNVTDFYLDSQLGLNRSTVRREVFAEQAALAEAELAQLEQARKNAMRMAERTDDEQMQVEWDARIRELLTEIKQEKAKLSEARSAIAAIDDQSSKLMDIGEMIQNERDLWENGTEEEVFVSRSKVAQSIRNFVTLINVDFENQVAIVEIAGGVKGYAFDRDGNLFDVLNMSDMPWENFEANLRVDGFENKIEQAKKVYQLIKEA